MKLIRLLNVLASSAAVFCSLNSSAIVSGERASFPTPTLSESFTNSYLEFSHGKTSSQVSKILKLFWFGEKNDRAELALTELKAISRLSAGADPTDTMTLQELARLQANFEERGFEPSKEMHWAPPSQLLVSYRDSVGPQREGDSYIHAMYFDYRMNYQSKTHVLSAQDFYPRLVLSGRVFMTCEEPFAKCRATTVTFDQAGVSWDQIPGPRGGFSSAGGGR